MTLLLSLLILGVAAFFCYGITNAERFTRVGGIVPARPERPLPTGGVPHRRAA